MIEATDIFEVIRKHRGDAIVLAGGLVGYTRWREYSDNSKRDVGGIVVTMGAMGPMALGVALAQPDEKVVLLDSEGSLLMNLGSLATTADQAPKNLYHFLLDNECYATTGGQPVPNAQDIDYAGMAKEAGYPSSFEFDDLEEFASRAPEVMNSEGPVFICVKTTPEIQNEPMGLRKPSGLKPTKTAIRDLKHDLGLWD